MLKINRKRIRTLTTLTLLIVGAAVGGGRRTVFAMPFFARKLGVPCSTCHTSPPRLNETGYKFRAAGYRMPGEIGKDGKDGENKAFNFFDYNGLRLQGRLDTTSTKIGPDATQKNKFY